MRQHHGTAKSILLILAALFFLAVTIAGALALSISVPAQVDEGTSLLAQASGTGTVTIRMDGAIVATGQGSASHALATNSSSQGTVRYLFSDNVTQEEREVRIVNVPLSLTVLEPLGSELQDNAVRFAVSTNWEAELCYVTVRGNSNTLQYDGERYSATIPLSDGIHEIAYKCKLKEEIVQQERIITIDTAPPIVTASGPSGTRTGPYVTLTADTDEISRCRYGTSEAAYSALAQDMGETHSLQHAATLRPGPGSHTYYLRCQDVYGNAMQTSEIISFLVRNGPTARIQVDEEMPLRAGTYRVELTTDLPLAKTPSLSYTLQESKQRHEVGLSGEGIEWGGYVSIPEGLEDTVLAFAFEGAGLDGVVGNEIAEGAVLTIDALPPGAITDLIIRNSTSAIELAWNDLPEAEAYRIYRSAQDGVTTQDQYATTMRAGYNDTSVLSARYYYYRIAAVDEAGNLGPLSDELQAGVVDALITRADPLLEARIEEELLSLHALELDVNATLARLEGEREPSALFAIEALDLVQKTRSLLPRIASQREELAALRDPSYADAVLARSAALKDEVRSSLVRRITTQAQAESLQQTDLSAIERNLAYALAGTKMSAHERDRYLEEAVALAERATIRLRAHSFTLLDYEGNEREYTYVEKEVALDTPASELRIIEWIPKEVANSAKEISFSKDPVVLEDDPVVQYSYGVLEREKISYVVNRLVGIDQVKRSRTLLYPALPETAAPVPEQKLTGLATGIGLLETSGQGLLVVLGIFLVLGLALYYVSMTPATPKSAPLQRIPAQRRIVARPLPRTPRKQEPPEEMLEGALQAIDEKRYAEARTLYDRLVKEGVGEALREDFARLECKIRLHEAFTCAAQSLESGDAERARGALETARDLALRIGEEQTVLIDEAKRTYTEMVRHLNALEIERTARY